VEAEKKKRNVIENEIIYKMTENFVMNMIDLK